MTKKKYNRFLDVVTVLLILFPLIMCLFTARSSGTFDIINVSDYVSQFAISPDLADLIASSVNTFGFSFSGVFANSAFVIMSNALLIWIFRLFVEVMTFLPKFAIKLLNITIGDRD